MSSASKEFSRSSDILGSIRLPKQVKEHLRNHEIWNKWDEIVGQELFRLTCPVELKSKVLEVQVAHQAWAQQLQFLKPSILGRIRNLCPRSEVKDLQFRIGKVTPLPRAEKQNPDATRELRLKPARLTERQEMTLRAVEDPDLRSVIRSAMEAAARRA